MADRQSAYQKARAALDVAARKVDKLEKRVDKLKADLGDAEGLLKTARDEHDYIAQHPALKPLQSDIDAGHVGED